MFQIIPVKRKARQELDTTRMHTLNEDKQKRDTKQFQGVDSAHRSTEMWRK
jgi:hypothetical protein